MIKSIPYFVGILNLYINKMFLAGSNLTTIVFHIYFSVSTRITWAITILLVSFVSLTVLSIPDSDRWQQKFLHAVILTIVASNVGVNVMQVIC
jgi:hypothetical protein